MLGIAMDTEVTIAFNSQNLDVPQAFSKVVHVHGLLP